MAVNRTDARVVAARYELTERLGRGGFGVVWRAHDRLLQRDVAVKEIQFPLVLDEGERDALRAKVLREARAAARLTHSGLVTVFDVVEEDGRPFIVMELVNAPTLAELVERAGPLSEEQAAAIGGEILEALTVAHAQGVIHRDVKPANVMVHNTGAVQLTDFGIAIMDDPTVTTSGQLAGSPSYMSPEQAQNLPATPATDLWGLGATLFYAVEGRPPFEKDGAIATLTSVVHDDPRPMQRAKALAPLLARLLAKEVHDRPGVDDVRRQLGDAVQPVPAPTMELAVEALPATPPPPRAAATTPPPLPTPPAASPPRAAPPPPQPASPPLLRSPRLRSPQRRRPGVLVVAVLATVALVAVLAAVLTRDRSPTSSTSGSGPQTTTGQTTPSSSATKVSKDWVSYRDPATGFTIAHPPGWTVRTSGTLTDIRDPSSGAYLRIDHQQPPGPSPEGAWYTLEPSFAADYPTYQRVRIAPTTYKGFRAAIWEFTYADGGADLRAVDLGFIAGQYGFALNFQTHAEDWNAMQKVFDQFKESFTAPS